MSYGRRAPLTPPADLVGQRVSWRPKGADGKRHPAVVGTVRAYDAEARTLRIAVPCSPSPWAPATESVVTIPLSAGPFTVR